MTRALALGALVAFGVTLAAHAADRRGEPGRDVGPRATLVVEGRPLAVGVVGEIVIAVRTAAGHRLLPVDPPSFETAEIVRTDTELREHAGGGWLHRIRHRVRPLAPDPVAWPATDLHIESPDGVRTRITLPARAFDVASVMRLPEDDRSPYGLSDLPSSERGRGGFLAGLATGVGVTLACVALIAWRRSRRDGSATAPADERTPAAEATAAGDRDAREAFAPARDALERDPREAAALAARALRSTASRRYGVDLRAATTPELRAKRPAAAPGEVWRELVDVIERHDTARFRAQAGARADIERDLAASEALAERIVSSRRREA